jgi:hypothetical protein
VKNIFSPYRFVFEVGTVNDNNPFARKNKPVMCTTPGKIYFGKSMARDTNAVDDWHLCPEIKKNK